MIGRLTSRDQTLTSRHLAYSLTLLQVQLIGIFVEVSKVFYCQI